MVKDEEVELSGLVVLLLPHSLVGLVEVLSQVDAQEGGDSDFKGVDGVRVCPEASLLLPRKGKKGSEDEEKEKELLAHSRPPLKSGGNNLPDPFILLTFLRDDKKTTPESPKVLP